MGSTIVGDPVTLVSGNLTLPLAGVAPGAWLLNYRVFYLSAAGETYASDTQILRAFEDAAAEGATIISNSWGRPSFYNKNGLIDQAIVCCMHTHSDEEKSTDSSTDMHRTQWKSAGSCSCLQPATQDRVF